MQNRRQIADQIGVLASGTLKGNGIGFRRRCPPDRRIGAVAVALMAMTVCLACNPVLPRPNVVRVGVDLMEPVSLDPTSAGRDAETFSVLSNFYEGLVAFDSDMRIVPALATSWFSPDDHTWLFELRRGVRFHDGAPLTADAVREALDWYRDRAQATSSRYLAGVRSIEAVGLHELRIKTERPDPLLLGRLANVLIGRVVADAGGQIRFVGTGPYQPTHWEPSGVREARAFPGYWGGKPPIDETRFVFAGSTADLLRLLEAGRLDVIRSTAPLRVPPGTRFRTVARATPACYYLWLESSKAGSPFSDQRVRQAISLAIDRKALCRIIGGGTPADQFVPMSVVGYVAGLSRFSFDPATARRLLAEAGWKKGFETTVSYAPGGIVTAALLEGLRKQLDAVGIRITPRGVGWADLPRLWSQGQLPAFVSGWRFENGDAESFLVDCIETKDAERSSGAFNPGFSSPSLDELIRAQELVFQPSEREAHYADIMRETLREMPIVPLFTGDLFYAVSNSIRWQPRLDGRVLAAEMSFRPGR